MHEVYFATNRSYLGRRSPAAPEWFGNGFHPSGPFFFRIGSASVSRDGERYKLEGVQVYKERKGASGLASEMLDQGTQWPEPMPGGYRVERYREGKNALLGSSALFEKLRKELLIDCRPIIIYIHGYASSFQDSLLRAAQLQHEYKIEDVDPILFVFSWPSDASLAPFVAYRNDRQDAQASGIAIARALMRLVDFLRDLDAPEHPAPTKRISCSAPMHLVAHSMGNWALRSAVQGVRAILSTDRLPRLFENAFLMAADEDDDALEHPEKLGLLPRLAHQVHVYHAANDRALQISNLTKGNPDRLGADGPRNLALADDRIYAVDCSDVSYTHLTQGRHQYYRLRREVIDDVRRVLRQEERPHELRIGERRWKLH